MKQVTITRNGHTYTLTLYWSKSMGRWVTIPE